MKKLKKNWRKIFLGIFISIIVVVLAAIVGIFLWVQTWKTLTPFVNGPITIKYPQNIMVIPDFGNSSLYKKGYFHFSATTSKCSNPSDEVECIKVDFPDFTQNSNNIQNHRVYIYETNRLDRYSEPYIAKNLIFIYNNNLYSLTWSQDFIDQKYIDLGAPARSKLIVNNIFQKVYLTLYNKLIEQLMINSIRFN